jgi:hypothetical protein
MPNEDTKEELKQPGKMIIELLQNQNKILGALSQTITTELRKISTDTELCKLYLGKLVKQGPVEVQLDGKTQSQSTTPAGPAPERPTSAIPGG